MVKASSTHRSKQVSPSRQRLLFTLLAFSSLTSGAALAAGTPLPTGGQFVAGAGAIASTANGLAISQSSTHGIINWQSFSIAAGKSVNIANGAGATLNRVTGGNLSSIAGSLTATGSVYVVNPSGVVVLPGGKVTTGGSFVASTRNVSNSDFMNGGAMTLSGTSSGAVVNQGTITSANGDVILVGKSVTNSGSISAAKGTAALAAGDNVLLQASGDDVVLVKAGSGDVTNTGTIAAAQVALDAAGGNVYALATNDGGVIRATGTKTKDGHVYLTGGSDVEIDGKVSATNADGSGGTIVATATALNIGATAKISADGKAKGGGTILLGGDRHGGSDPSVALSKTTIANAQTTTVAAGATISANAGAKGKGGNVVVWSDQATSYSGSISAKGGATSGDGGFVEVSGKSHLSFVGAVTTTAAHGATGTLLLDPSNVTIVDSSGSYTDNTNNVPVTVTYTPPTPTTNESTATAGGSYTYTPNGTGTNASLILNTDIQTQLASNNVVITTGVTGNATGGAGTGTGNITIAAPVTWSSASTLELDAAGSIASINPNATLSATGAGGSIILNAGGAGIPNNTAYAVNLLGGLSATTGTITVNMTNSTVQRGVIHTNGNITTTTGDINIVTTYNITTNGDIKSTSGNINLVSTGANSLMQIGNTNVVQTGGAGKILLQSDTVSLGSGGDGSETGQAIADTTQGKVTVQPSSNNPIEIGSFGAASILLDQDVANITAGTLVIGSNGSTAPLTSLASIGVTKTTAAGNTISIMLADNLDSNSFLTSNLNAGPNAVPLSTVGNLHLIASGYVSENNPNGDGNYGLTVHGGTGGLAITAGTYIDFGYNGAVGPLGVAQSANKVGALAMEITGAGVATPASDGVASTASAQFTGTSSSGAITIGTVDTVSGIKAPASTGVGSVSLNTTGAVVQDTVSATNNISAASLDLEGGATGAFTLNNTANAISNVAGTFSTLSLYNNTNLTTAVLGSSTGLNGAGAITIVDNGTLTIAAGDAIKTTGGNILLEDQKFVNADGAAAFSASGYWRVYSQDPTVDTNGTTAGHSNDGLTYSFVQYNAPNSYGPGVTPFATANTVLNGAGGAQPSSTTGNGFIYSVAPKVSETLTGTFNKTYDGSNSVTGNITTANYGAISGAINGDTVTFSNPTGTNIATYDSAHQGANRVITLNTAPSVGMPTDRNTIRVYGYGITLAGGFTGTISALPITVTGNRLYDGSTNANGGILTIGNVAAADSGSAPTISGTGTGALAGKNVLAGGASQSVNSFTNYTLGNNPNGDYTLTGASGSVRIDPVALTIGGSKSYDTQATAPVADLTTSSPQTGDAFGAGGDLTLNGTAGTTGSPNHGTYTGAGTGAANFGLGDLNLTGAAAIDYTLTPGTFTINAAALTVTPNAVTIGYNGSTLPNGTYSDTLSNYTFGPLQGSETTTSAGIALSGSMAFNNSTATTVHDAVSYALTAGTLGLTSNNGNYSLNFTNPALNAYVITKAPLTIGGSKTYDAAATAPIADITSQVGAQSGDSFGSGGNLVLSGTAGTTGASGAATYTGTGTGAANFGLGDLNLTGAAALNYTLTPGTFIINAASITVATVFGERFYDGTTTAAGSLLSVTDKASPTDDVSLTGTGIGALGGVNVGTQTITSFSTYSLTGAQKANYTLTGASGTVKIDALPITVTGMRTYDGTTTAAGSLLTITDVQPADIGSAPTILGTGAGAVASKNANATAQSITSFTNYTLGNNPNGNYTLTNATGLFTITPLPITVTGTRTYDGTTTAAGNLLTITDVAPSDSGSAPTITGTGANALGSKNANPTAQSIASFANYTLGNANGNYTLTNATGLFTITPLPITVTGTRTYDGTTTAAGSLLTITDVQPSDIGSAPTISGTGANALGSKNANPTAQSIASFANYTLGNANGNYTLTNATGLFTITPLPITVTGTRTYDGTTTAAGNLLTITDVQPSDIGSAPTISGTGVNALGSKNASATAQSIASFANYTLGNANGNYTLTNATGLFTITPLPITVTGTRTYDGTTTAAGNLLTITDVAPSDSGSAPTITGTGANALGTKNANPTAQSIASFANYTLGNANGNYTLTNATGLFTITPLPITVTGTRTYDGTTTAAGNLLTITDVQPSDSGSAPTISGTGVNALGSKNASATAQSIASFANYTLGNANGNYTLTNATGLFTITPLPITVTGTRTYDGTTTAAGNLLTITDVAPSDSGSVPTISGTGANALGSKNANPTAQSIASFANYTLGNANGNYTLTNATGLFTITPLPITVTGTRTYDGTTTAAGNLLTITDVAPSDSGSAPTISGTGVNALGSKNASATAQSIASFANYTLGNANGNYTLTNATGLFTITPLPITVTGTRTYDGTTTAAGNLLTITDVAPSDSGSAPTISGTGVNALGSKNASATAQSIASFANYTLGNANGNYTLTNATGLFTITPLPITVTGTRTYDGTTTAAGNLLTITDVAPSDSGSAPTISGTGVNALGSKNASATAQSIASFTNYTLGNNASGNYTLTNATGLFTITPLPITVTGTRTYDGTTTAAGNLLTITDVQPSDSGSAPTISGTGVNALGSKNANPTAQSIASFANYTLGNANGNYTLTNATGLFTIGKANLTIAAVTDTKVYDGTTGSTGTPTIAGLQTGDSVSGSPLTQAFGSKNVAGTNGSTLSVTNFTGVNDGNGGGNYTVTVNTALGTITPLAVTLAGTRTYDGMTDAAGTILSATNDLDGANLTIGGTGVLAAKNVGPEALTATNGSLTGLTLGGSAATNYTLASATGSVNVTKAGLVISAVTQTKTYDGTTGSTGTPTIAGLQTGDSVSGSPLTQAFGSKNVAGTNGSTLSVTNFTGVNDGNGGGNYTVTVNTALGTITPLAVTLAGTRTYDGMTDAAGTILSATNDLDGANLTIGGTGVLAAKNVGPEALTATNGSLTGLTLGGSAATNYTLASATGSVNVTKAGLVISAVTQTKTYDGTTGSTGTPTIAGLQTGDSVSGSPLTQAFGSKNVAGTNGSTLSVTNFTGVNDGNGGGNYTVTVNTALGTITPLAVTLAGTRTYDGMTDAAGTILSATNDLDGANLTIGGTGVLAAKNVGPEALTATNGSLTGLTLGGSAATNYTLASATGSVNVTKAGLVISAVTQTKTYDGTTGSTGTPTIAGLQTGDSVSGSPLTQAFGSKNVAGTNGSTLSVTNFTGVNDGNGGGNYTVTVNTALGTITPLAVTLAGTRTYDGMTDAAGTILSATNDLDGANLTIGGTGVLAAKNVGPEALTATNGSLTGLTLGGSAATNYTLASATGSVNVTKAGLVISAVTQTKTYDGTTGSTGTPTIAGLQTGDSVSGSPLTQAFGSKNVAGTNGSTLSVTNFTGVNDGNGGGNYTVTVNTALGTITPLAVTLAGTRTYDGMTDAAGTILSATNDLDGANLTIGGTGVLAAKNVGPEALTATNGSLTGLTLGGSAATNYTLASATGSVNVTKAALVISAVTDTKVYDGGVSSVGKPTIAGLQTGDSVSGSPLTQIFGSKNVLGANGSTLSVNNFTGVNDSNSGANYNVTVNTAPGTITPLAVNETGTRVYNGTPGVNGSIITIANAIPGDTVGVTGAGTLGGKDTGTQTITVPGTLTLTGGDAGNYTTTGGSSAITITPFAVTLAGTRVYDGNTDGNAPILGVTNAFAGDTVTVASGASTIASKNVGPEAIANFGTLALGGASAGDYTLIGATGTVTVTPLAVTLAGTRVYDGLTDGNASILSVTNAIAGDNPIVASGASTIASKNVGPEGITSFGTLALGNNPAGNYTLVGATGVVAVTPLSVISTGTRVYNGTPVVNGPILTITDKIPGDTVSIIGTGTLTGKDKGPQTVSTLGTLTLTGGDAGNYVFNPAASTVTITPFAVNLAGTRAYDGLTDGNGNILSVTNAFAGDSVNVASGTSTIANKNVGIEGITNFGTLALGNNIAGDYTLVGATGAVKVTPLALTVTAVNTPKVYDGGNGSSGTPVITVGTLQGTDTGAFIQQFGTKNAGTGLTLTPSGLVTDGNGGNNYIVTFAPITTGVINPKPVVLNGTRPFDNTPGALASILNITNLIPGDLVTLGGIGTLVAPAPGLEPINNFTGLTLAGGPAANYTFVGATGTVLVTPVIMPTIAEILTVPSTQTSSGTGETVSFSAFSGGILTLTPKQNGVVTGTIATIDGNDYQPDAQLGCTLGQDGCVQNGVAVTPAK